VSYHAEFGRSRSNVTSVITDLHYNPPLKVTQGHQNWYQIIGYLRLPINLL